MDKEGKDLRRFPRFDFGGTAMLVYDDPDKRRTLAITNYRNISKAGACVITPDAQSFTVGDQLYLMLERYRRKREAVIVNQGVGRLHLDIPRADEFSDFELAEVLQRLQAVLDK
ncbi:MAG TPA: hypothetical protein VG742_04395 [Dongiaceae bacterium]|nr:hypothetical protein [Dongiaceae bacterium]